MQNKKNRIYQINNHEYFFIDSIYNKLFKNEIVKILKQKNIIPDCEFDIKYLHEYVFDKSMLIVEPMYKQNKISIELYETNYEIDKLYLEFMKDLYQKLKFDFYFQKTPTIRVHCPHETANQYFPSYHSDCFLGHPPQEINIWFSLTKNEHSGFFLIDIENSEKWLNEVDNDIDLFMDKNKNDIDSKYKGNDLSFEIESHDDKILLFDSNCIHTNQARKDDCRLSIDVRINPVDDFVEGYVGKGRMKAEFKPGGKMGYAQKPISQYINLDSLYSIEL